MFSIIIPVHNSEKTLEKCLNSVINQTYTDFEALLIENGSKDGSFEICLEYAQKDSRFKAFDIGVCNGPSKARNFGLEKATGEYVAFLDSDDHWGNRFLEMLAANFTENTDVVFFSFNHEKADGSIGATVIPDIAVSDIKKVAIELNKQGCFGYTCCKAFRRDVVNDIRFNESLDLFEDEVFALSVLNKAKTVIVVPNTYYYYYYYHVVDSCESLMNKYHNDIIEKKDLQFCAWEIFLGNEFDEVLVDMANAAVRFCRFYIYEHRFNLKDSFYQIKSAKFYQVAMRMPTHFTRRTFKSIISFRVDWIIWRLKHEYILLFSRRKRQSRM